MEQDLEYKILTMMMNDESFYSGQKYKISILPEYQARVELYRYPNTPKGFLLFNILEQSDSDFLIGLKPLYVKYNDSDYGDCNEVYQKLMNVECSIPLKGFILFINTFQKYIKRVPLDLRDQIIKLLKS